MRLTWMVKVKVKEETNDYLKRSRLVKSFRARVIVVEGRGRGRGEGGREIEAVERNFPDVPGRNPSLQSRLAIKRLLED